MARNSRRIGDVAKAGGVGVETVRFYEREGFRQRFVVYYGKSPR